ncbi:MAG: nucleotidyltransferase domain-containing protein [Oligoflexus sp.]
MLKLTARPLDKNEQESIIHEKLSWILANCSPKKVILFGSAARREMTEASDIDMIIIFSNEQDLKAEQNRLNRSRKPTDWPQDLIFYSASDFQRSVATGGGAAWLANKEGQIIFSDEEAKL